MTQLMTAVLLTASLEATAAKHTISAADFSFSPAALTVSLGDTIEWVHANGSHTTTSQMIPPGAAAWDAPLDTANPSFIYVPSEPGNYSYICVPHQSMGMAGSFTVLGPTSVKQPGTLSLRLAPNPA